MALTSSILPTGSRSAARCHAVAAAPMLAASTTDTRPAALAAATAGIALIAVGVGMMLRNRLVMRRWRRTTAVVTANVERSIGGGNHDVFPVFTFVDAHGIEHTVQRTVNRPRFRVGQWIDVFHDPDDPYRLQVDHWAALHLGPALLWLAGCASLVLVPFVLG